MPGKAFLPFILYFYPTYNSLRNSLSVKEKMLVICQGLNTDCIENMQYV